MSLKVPSASQRTERSSFSLGHIGMAGWLSLFFPVSSFTYSPFMSFLSFYVSLFPSLFPLFSPKFPLCHLFPSLSTHASLYLLISLSISLFSTFLSSGFSFHCSLFLPISSILTSVMTPRPLHPADYAKGFGGQYGIQKDRVDKVKY